MPKKPTPPPRRPNPSHPEREPNFLSANQVVAHNLSRVRRALGMTQAEAADLLRDRTGQEWTAATLGAAERSASGGRTRAFDANDLLAFSVTFQQPIAYFFMPPDSQERDAVVLTATSPGSWGISERQLLAVAVPLKYSAQVIDDVNRTLAKDGQTWSPHSRVEWYRPEENEGVYYDAIARDVEEENEEVANQTTFTFTPTEMRKTLDGILQEVKMEVLQRWNIEIPAELAPRGLTPGVDRSLTEEEVEQPKPSGQEPPPF